MNPIFSTGVFKRSTVSIAVALASFSVYSDAFAEEVETIVVQSEGYRNTATKTALQPEETPQGITIIEGEAIEQRDAESLSQALRYAPGVVTEVRGGAVTLYDTFTIRGFGVDKSYYDGLVLSYLNGWNLQAQIDPVAIEQIEVFKGPTSVLYGSMPPGGMVNIIAKAPEDVASTEVSVATGSHSLVEASVDSTGPLGDTGLNYRFIAKASQQDGQVDTTEEETLLLAPSIDWHISDKTLVNFNLYYQNDPEMGMNSSLPASGMIYDNDAGSTSASTFVGDKNWSEFEREVFMAGYKINHELSDSWTFLQNFRYTDASLSQKNTYHLASNFDEETGTLVRNIYSTEEEVSAVAIDNQLSGVIITGDLEHNVLLGVDYQNLEGDSAYSEYYTTDNAFYEFNIFSPDNDLLDTDTLVESYAATDDIDVEQLGFYVQDQLRWNQLVLISGGRFDHYKSTSYYEDNYAYTAESDAEHSQFSYRVGALYELSNGLSPFVSYATSFEPVTGVDADGNSFDPELGSQVEAGVKYVSLDGGLAVAGSVFHIVKSDALVSDPDSTYGDQLQIGELVSQGVEIELAAAITPAWQLNASYTYTDMEITEDTDSDLEGTTPIWVPEHSSNLWSDYYILEGLLTGARISGGVRYVGEMQMDAYNTDTVPGYTLVDFSIGYDVQRFLPGVDSASLNLAVNNAFNEEYYSCYDSANCWYGAERTATVSFNATF
ncbi:TonB-dependent siderophore receptor [Reinekea marinisedimentorum]|uniref:Iron complex outermembrane receptor protein n=1 Tax=Reinekea marinisedimentorum TaxID=230495 RepID=A0A4R3HUK8_9GAMM|nr:TonB-dependent siderophore receptor [Reinekea marinisedimentorum]TCS36738.1 iron complex outermembrane receptor protein [Reinekea marinisedimentorum]